MNHKQFPYEGRPVATSANDLQAAPARLYSDHETLRSDETLGSDCDDDEAVLPGREVAQMFGIGYSIALRLIKAHPKCQHLPGCRSWAGPGARRATRIRTQGVVRKRDGSVILQRFCAALPTEAVELARAAQPEINDLTQALDTIRSRQAIL